MCFSAEASFISGGILMAVGVASLKQVKTSSHSLFAAIPVIFAIQQISEGFLWLAMRGKIDPAWHTLFSYIFIFVAQVVWPIWIPLSIGLLEKNKTLKKKFYILTLVGLVASGWIAVCLLNFSLTASIDGNHISYTMGLPLYIRVTCSLLYFIATIFPSLFSSTRRMPWLGILAAVSYFISYIFFEKYVISVWCFFAAIISIVVYFISKDEKETFEKPQVI